MSKELHRVVFAAPDLVATHPPKWKDKNKKLVYDISAPPGSKHSGTITYTRWNDFELPERFEEKQPEFVMNEGLFEYAPSAAGWMDWHLNFAHSLLFGFYEGRLFAQDEMQVTEHPALGSLRDALKKTGMQAYTVENQRPTPCLIMGVERRCEVKTDANEAEGRPDGLYGNRFAMATPEALQRATRLIEPPTLSNILAIEALQGGTGEYTLAEIEYTLATAFTGFYAAYLESKRAHPKNKVSIHTGFWGCGAYGGNRVLMSALQIAAAQLAGIDRLIFYTHTSEGTRDYQRGLDLVKSLGDARVQSWMHDLTAMKFQWGVSDGN